MREPQGEWITRCMSPASSKKRSNTMRRSVGSTPSAAFDAPRYSASCCAAGRCSFSSSASQRSQASTPLSSRSSACAASRDTAWHNSSLRPRLSPSQNGIDGGWPRASSTSTFPVSTLTMRYEALPSWNTSPGRLSNAKSSLSVPMRCPSGCSTTS